MLQKCFAKLPNGTEIALRAHIMTNEYADREFMTAVHGSLRSHLMEPFSARTIRTRISVPVLYPVFEMVACVFHGFTRTER